MYIFQWRQWKKVSKDNITIHFVFIIVIIILKVFFSCLCKKYKIRNKGIICIKSNIKVKVVLIIVFYNGLN